MRRRAGRGVAPDRAWAYMRLGNLAIAAKDMKLADELFSRSFEIDPEFLESYSPQWVFARLTGINDAMSEASRQHRHSDWEALVEQVKWVLELAPDNLRAHFQLGLLYEYQNRGEDAKDEYATVIGGREGLANQSLESMREEARKAVYGMRFIMDLNTPVYPAWRKAEPGPWQVYRRGPFVIQHHNEALGKTHRGGARRQPRAAGPRRRPHAQRPVSLGVQGAGLPGREQLQARGHADVGGGTEQVHGARRGNSRARRFNCTRRRRSSWRARRLYHELAHVRLVASAHFYEGLPLWLQEGMASTAESQVKRTATVRALVEARNADRMIPIEDLDEDDDVPRGAAGGGRLLRGVAGGGGGARGEAREGAVLEVCRGARERGSDRSAHDGLPAQADRGGKPRPRVDRLSKMIEHRRAYSQRASQSRRGAKGGPRRIAAMTRARLAWARLTPSAP